MTAASAVDKNNNDKRTKNNTKKQHETCHATERVPKKSKVSRHAMSLLHVLWCKNCVHDEFEFGFGSRLGPVTAQNTQNQTEGEFGFGFGSRSGPA